MTPSMTPQPTTPLCPRCDDTGIGCDRHARFEDCRCVGVTECPCPCHRSISREGVAGLREAAVAEREEQQ